MSDAAKSFAASFHPRTFVFLGARAFTSPSMSPPPAIRNCASGNSFAISSARKGFFTPVTRAIHPIVIFFRGFTFGIFSGSTPGGIFVNCSG